MGMLGGPMKEDIDPREAYPGVTDEMMETNPFIVIPLHVADNRREPLPDMLGKFCFATYDKHGRVVHWMPGDVIRPYHEAKEFAERQAAENPRVATLILEDYRLKGVHY